MGENVPTVPGEWWAEIGGRRRIVEVRRNPDGYLWFEPGLTPYQVGNEPRWFGRWLAPVATVEEVEQLRAFRAAVGDIQAGASDSDEDVLALVQADHDTAHDVESIAAEVASRPRPRWRHQVSPADNDSAIGADRAPARYMRGERETIDRMRDLAHAIFGNEELADLAFAFHCAATQMKYEDRAGLKGAADEDLAKARWYGAMTNHVLSGGEDPRENRPDYEPWKRPDTPDGVAHALQAWALTPPTGSLDGLFRVGRGPAFNGSTWRTLSPWTKRKLRLLVRGDVVDVLLPDGRIVRTTCRGPVTFPQDEEGREIRTVPAELRVHGIGDAIYADRARPAAGWRQAQGCVYHDHIGLTGQRVPYTCPTIRKVLRLIGKLNLDLATKQSITGHLELPRSYNAQLRRNHTPWRPSMARERERDLDAVEQGLGPARTATTTPDAGETDDE